MFEAERCLATVFNDVGNIVFSQCQGPTAAPKAKKTTYLSMVESFMLSLLLQMRFLFSGELNM